MSNQPMRRLEDMTEAEQIAVLDKMKAFLLDVLCEHLQNGNIDRNKLTDHEKRMVATHTPSNTGRRDAPSAEQPSNVTELNAADVLQQAEAILS